MSDYWDDMKTAAAINERLARIEGMTLSLAEQQGYLAAKLDELLALLKRPQHICGCCNARYVDELGEWHCDYCDGVRPKPKPSLINSLFYGDGAKEPAWQLPVHDPNGGRRDG